jgi:hypothetical protein
MSRHKGRNSTTLSIRIPFPLYYKIKYLATKRKLSVNDWAKRCLLSSAHYEPERDNPLYLPNNKPIRGTVITKSGEEYGI